MPPDFAALAAQALAASELHLGSDCTWTAAGGSPVTVRCVPAGESQEYSGLGPLAARPSSPGAVLEAAAAVVAPAGLGQAGSIADGDLIHVLGEQRAVKGAPVYADPLRQVVRFETRRV